MLLGRFVLRHFSAIVRLRQRSITYNDEKVELWLLAKDGEGNSYHHKSGMQSTLSLVKENCS